jgi:large conductance mechanosensitive channel
MKNFVTEFRAFAMRGNVVDLAVAVVIGAAFGKIVSSLVENIITPIIGMLLGGVNFTGLSFTVGEAVISYGVFIQSVFDFVVIALAIFFAVRLIAKLKDKEDDLKEEVKKTSEEVLLLREIRDSLLK